MNAENMSTSVPDKIWRFANQTWTQIDDPLIDAEAQTLNDALYELGYVKADDWSGDAVEIYAHADDRWFVCCCFDGDKGYLIEVPALPDLIGLLAQLAPIATASMLSLTNDLLRPLIYNLSEDAGRERNRRGFGTPRGAL